MRKTFILCCGALVTTAATTVATTAALAQSLPNIRPVPGSGASYVYFPGETEGRVKLSITKDYGNMVPDRYAIYYRPQGKREELLCKEDQEHCEKLVPSGQGRIRIAGFYDPAKKLPITHAKFSGACSTTGKQCNLNLRGSGAETLRITTGCNGRDYSVVDFGGKNGQVLCVGVGISNPNTYLLAAHQQIRSKRTKLVQKSDPPFTSKTDGKANTKRMLQSWEAHPEVTRLTTESAAHYCQRMTVGEGQGRLVEWYVPAINELDQALGGWEGANQNFVIPKDSTGYYSSTETGSQSTEVIRWNNAKQKTSLAYTAAGSVLCMYSVGM